ncbi:MAG TPA: hypothetical protein VD813_05045 [Pseudonocardia sp.]|nr:hypothetical protein [Pseudonocardia sp.]
MKEREALDAVWRSRDDERVARRHAERDAVSLDGLPGPGVEAPTGP